MTACGVTVELEGVCGADSNLLKKRSFYQPKGYQNIGGGSWTSYFNLKPQQLAKHED